MKGVSCDAGTNQGTRCHVAWRIEWIVNDTALTPDGAKMQLHIYYNMVSRELHKIYIASGGIEID